MSVLSRAVAKDRPSLVAYLCVGDPDVATSLEIARALVDAGADVIELGVPFSDPIADGPVIAAAAHRAIAAGSTLLGALDLARALGDRVPLVLMTYLNPMFSLGGEGRVAVARAKDAGIAGVLLVDQPGDEDSAASDALDEHGLDRIVLVAPTTTEARRRVALERAGGFVYVVSVTGVTGASAVPVEDARRSARVAREASGLPAVVGFGIDTPEKAARMVEGARDERPDGVVVGTAIVKAVAEGGSAADRVRRAAKVVESIRSALG